MSIKDTLAEANTLLAEDLLSEDVFGVYYTVKKIKETEWEVAKFDDAKAPSSVWNVWLNSDGTYGTDAYSFKHLGQSDKHIALVKAFINAHKDGMKDPLYFIVRDSNGEIEVHSMNEALSAKNDSNNVRNKKFLNYVA